MISLLNGVGVDAQLTGKAAHAGQLCARRVNAQHHKLGNAVFDLQIDGIFALIIQCDQNAALLCIEF